MNILGLDPGGVGERGKTGWALLLDGHPAPADLGEVTNRLAASPKQQFMTAAPPPKSRVQALRAAQLIRSIDLLVQETLHNHPGVPLVVAIEEPHPDHSAMNKLYRGGAAGGEVRAKAEATQWLWRLTVGFAVTATQHGAPVMFIPAGDGNRALTGSSRGDKETAVRFANGHLAPGTTPLRPAGHHAANALGVAFAAKQRLRHRQAVGIDSAALISLLLADIGGAA